MNLFGSCLLRLGIVCLVGLEVEVDLAVDLEVELVEVELVSG